MTAAMAADSAPKRRLHLTEAHVARVERIEPEAPAARGLPYMEDADYLRQAQRLLAEAGDDPIWVFGYGSLIWKPAFDAVDSVPCLLHGWRRSFCLHLESWRGTPDEPGLMLALDRGGACRGIAYRMPDDGAEAAMEALLRREIGYAEDLQSVRWLTARAAGQVIRVLVFYAAPLHPGLYVKLPVEEQAHRLARAAGHMGSCAAYLHNTVRHLEDLGIHDRYLWQLQQMVADRIDQGGTDQG